MLGLRFFECRQCGTVYAGPAVPPHCEECPDAAFTELTDRLQADTYFSRRRERS